MPFLPNSIFARTLFFLIPFVVLIAVLYTLLVLLAIQFTEDHIASAYLEQELATIKKQYSGDVHGQELPHTSYLKSYWQSSSDLPKLYLALPVGIHEVNRDKTHLLIAELSNNQERIYLELDEDKLSSIDRYKMIVTSILFSFGGLIVIGGCVLGGIIVRTLTGPVKALADDVKSNTNFQHPFYGSDRNDEIGILSNALNSLVTKLKTVLDREKAFTRHASHELRTPVSVITNALAVIDLDTCSKEKRLRNLARIKHANSDISNLIDVFLSLGRNRRELQQSNIQIQEIIDNLLYRLQPEIQRRGFTIDKHLDSEAQVSSSPGLLSVLFHNLLVNALTHGKQNISIYYNGVSLTISNPIETNPSLDTSYGYGLEIVERICRHQGWTLSIDKKSQLFSVSIDFINK